MMEVADHLLHHSMAVSAAVFRLGRPIPGPFAHIGPPFAPYNIPTFAHPYVDSALVRSNLHRTSFEGKSFVNTINLFPFLLPSPKYIY